MASAQTNSLIQKLQAQPPQEIIMDLYRLKLREKDGEQIEQPFITITLFNKQPVSGFLVDYKSEQPPSMLWVREMI